MTSEPRCHLHTYYRSSCSARVRTAAYLKSIPLDYTYIHLIKAEQKDPSYTRVNPSGSVPTLTYIDASGTEIKITQSIAILEFFEEAFPDARPLLPPPTSFAARARVRELMNIVANDIQPPTNLRILNRVRDLGGDAAEWARDLMTEGLEAYESLVESSAGLYSVGNDITLADVCLAPAAEGALKFGVDLDALKNVKRIYDRIKTDPAFVAGDWKHQDDTPADFRVL